MKNAAQWDAETIERLKELGLTEYDAKVYLTLVARSPMAATDISREADVPMSKIYGVLSRLENGGWISVVPERPKQYRAVDPGVTVDHACSEAVGRLESSKSVLLQTLKETYDSRGDVEASEFLVVHGTVNAMLHLKEIVQSARGVSVLAAFIDLEMIEKIHQQVQNSAGTKQIYYMHGKDEVKKFSERFSTIPYARALAVHDRWPEGIIFVYTKGSGMYGTVEGSEFKKALVIRDRGLLELIKMLIEMSHGNAISLGEDPESHVDRLNAHKAKAIETFDKLLSKHK